MSFPYLAPRRYDVPYEGHVGGRAITKSAHEYLVVDTHPGNNYADGNTIIINGKTYEVDTAAAPGVGGGNIAVVIDVITPDTLEIVATQFVLAIQANDPAVVASLHVNALGAVDGFQVKWKKADIDSPPATGGGWPGALADIVTHILGAIGTNMVPARHGEPYGFLPPFPYEGIRQPG